MSENTTQQYCSECGSDKFRVWFNAAHTNAQIMCVECETLGESAYSHQRNHDESL